MFTLSGHWPPALQSFLCKALSSAGFIFEKHSLLSPYILSAGFNVEKHSLLSPYVLLKGIEAFLVEDVDQEAEPLDSSLLSRCPIWEYYL